MPWLALDPLDERANRLHRLEEFFSGERLPAFIRGPLVERGYSVGLTQSQLEQVLSGGDDGAGKHFDLVQERVRLYAWDFWRVPAGGWLRLAGLGSAIAMFAGVAVLVLRQFSPDEGPLSDQTAAAILGLGMFSIALLVILAAPHADTFGLAGGGKVPWGVAWLDVLTGAEATAAPRALVPGGLLLLTMAQLLYYVELESRIDDDESIDEFGDETYPGYGMGRWGR